MRWPLFQKNSLTQCGEKNFDWGSRFGCKGVSKLYILYTHRQSSNTNKLKKTKKTVLIMVKENLF